MHTISIQAQVDSLNLSLQANWTRRFEILVRVADPLLLITMLPVGAHPMRWSSEIAMAVSRPPDTLQRTADEQKEVAKRIEVSLTYLKEQFKDQQAKLGNMSKKKKVKAGQIYESLFDSSKRAFITEKKKQLYIKYNYGSQREKKLDEAFDVEVFFRLAEDSPNK